LARALSGDRHGRDERHGEGFRMASPLAPFANIVSPCSRPFKDKVLRAR